MKGTSSPTNKEWFLETSVPRVLLFGHSLQKKAIKKSLQSKRSYTSQYVRMEYKRSVVKALIKLHYLVRESDTPSDAIQLLSQSYSGRETKLILSALGEFIKEPDISGDKEKFLHKVEMWIVGALEHLDSLVRGYVENRTGCPLARASIDTGYERFLEEIDCKTACEVEKLWKQSKTQLQALVSAGESNPHNKNKGFTKPLPLIQATVTNPEAPKQKRKCMEAGDFIIALEMPNRLRMLTLDRAFESICQVLGKDVYRVPSLAELRATASSA